MSGEKARIGSARRALAGTRRAVRRVIAGARRHGRALVALVAVAVFVGGPAYSATRPDFFNRFEGMSEKYETWNASTHANVYCQSCHVGPGLADRVVYSARMVGEAYLALLPLDREPPTLERPSRAACSQCHIDLRAVSPAGDLLIPHLAHVDALGIDCARCHLGELVHNVDPAVTTTPRMATCLDCHDNVQAPGACDACHTEKGIPANHAEPTFIIDHAARVEEMDCTVCHAWREDWCRECHERRPRSHGSGENPSEFRAAHGYLVEARPARNCEACHETEFCVRCHGEIPQESLNPALELVR